MIKEPDRMQKNRVGDVFLLSFITLVNSYESRGHRRVSHINEFISV